MPKLTSIICSSFNNTRQNTHITMLCLQNIVQYTNPDEYELILVDPAPQYPVRDDYKVLKIDKWVKPKKDPGYPAGMNMGAKMAKGDYLCFIQNDVFVNEGWLEGLRFYLENGYDTVWPDQVPRSREYILETYKRDPLDPESLKGGRDEGLFMMTKEAFKKTGGFPEDLSILVARGFYDRMNKAGVNWTDTNKVHISHITASTNLSTMDTNPKLYNKRMERDAKKLNG